MNAYYKRAVCPRCNRTVANKDGRYGIHSIAPHSGVRCRMTGQRVTITGLTPADHEDRARLVVDLAWQVKDEDPLVVWEYLTATPADELQRLLMVALAGVPVDRKVDDIFAWVHQLPVARGVSA